MRFVNERAELCGAQVRQRSAEWEKACQRLGATTVRTMADEFVVQRGAGRFVVNWVSSGIPCVRSVGGEGRRWDAAAGAFKRELLRVLGA